MSEKYIILDTETTGFEPGKIAQLAYILMNEKLKIEKAKNFYFKLEEMPTSASNIHHLTVEALEELSNGKTFKDNAEVIENDLKDRILISHNIPFDLSFIRSELNALNVRYNPETFCTMEAMTPKCNLSRVDPLTQEVTPKWPRLTEALDYWKIPKEKVLEFSTHIFKESKAMHDARWDTTACRLIFRRLKLWEMKQ
jgi:DNA polymerase III epsilon subunit-like protein